MTMNDANERAAKLQPIPRISVFQAVVDQITAWLASDAVTPGERLPSERELSEQLQVSRASLREALRALRAAGVIESRGRGAYLKPARTDRTEAAPLAISFTEAERLELHEFRGAIEAEIAALAAERADGGDVRRLRQELAAMERETPGDRAAFFRADHAFHRSLADAARNRLLQAALEQVHQHLPIQYSALPAGVTAAHQEEQERAVRAHRHILDAVVEHDGGRARQAMRGHIAQTRQQVLTNALTRAAEAPARLAPVEPPGPVGSPGNDEA